MAGLDLQALAGVFQQTLSPAKETIKAAEAHLKAASQQPGYSIAVLQLVANPAVDATIRQAAAVNFKNTIKYRWVPTEADLYGGAQPLPEDEKAQIKQLLLGLMLGTPALVQAQLMEGLSLICAHDFPARWPGLLPELVQKLAADDLLTTRGVLQVANNVFKRFRGQPSSNNQLAAELDTCQQAFLVPLRGAQARLRLAFTAAATAQDIEALRQVLNSMRLAFRCFYSLCSMGLSEATESDLAFWMDEMHDMLTYDNPALAEQDPEKESVPDAVKGAVCQTIDLLLEIDKDTFKPHLQRFAASVWGVLMKVSHKPGQDNLAMAAIKFLTTIARGVYSNLFAADGALQQICESIIVPNLRVRPEDEEMFEMNPTEYIRRDAEGGDSDTRRRAAADLVKALTERFPQEVARLFTGYIGSALSEYAANPKANWRAKDCAVYMVTALTVKGKTAQRGATSTNAIVNLLDFYTAQVLPELQSPAVSDQPLLKADAIKFLTTFRSVLPKEACLAAFPCLVALLGSEYCVVHSYAAVAVERLLSLRDAQGPSGAQLCFTPQDLGPNLQPLLERLFAGFKLPDSSENEYLMKAVMRVIGFVGPVISPVSAHCLKALAQMLVDVCKNPRNPGFNHYLFESVAALIRHGTAANPASIVEYEAALFPAFETVLQQDVQEFHPYVFQIFAQLIELRPAPLPPIYLQIFPPLLAPLFWERSGNVPALVRLLQAYLSKAGSEVAAGGHLVAVLGVFQKLLSSKAHDHEGFYIINAVVEGLPLPAYEQFLPTVLTLMFQRLTGSKTPKFCRFFVVFLALFIAKHGPGLVSAQLDKVQAGIAFMLLQQIWLPTMQSIEGAEEEKVVTVATARLLAELPGFGPSGQHGALWVALRDALKKKMEGGAGGASDQQEEEEPDFEEMAGYSAAYAKLANASKPDRPVLAEIQDPKQYIESTLARMNSAH